MVGQSATRSRNTSSLAIEKENGMGEIWQIGNTGVRNPMRIQDALRAYSESGFVGNIRGVPREIAFMKYLGEKGLLNNEDGRDPSGSYGRKFRLMFNNMGFAYNRAGAYRGVTQEEIGPLDELTPFGRSFLRAETVPAIQEHFLRALSVRMEDADGGGAFSPLRWTLAVLLAVRERSGEASVSFQEFAAYVQCSTPASSLSQVVGDILVLRINRHRSTAKKRFDTDFFKRLFDGNSTKAATCKDYADMNLRYLKATGLLRSKGKGVVVVDEKMTLVEKIVAQDQICHDDIKSRLAELYNGAVLPCDDREVAMTVLEGLKRRLDERGIQYTLDVGSLDAATDVNTACHNLEELLSRNEEEKYAKRQKDEWLEIADYMDLLITKRSVKQYDDDREIKIPKEEASAYLEWCLWRAFLAMNTLENKPYEVRRFKVDQDFFPVGTAPGRGPDLLARYSDCSVVIEVTLSDSSRQEAMEGEPVRRHVSDVSQNDSVPTYGLFVANHVDTNTVETFRTGTWYTRDDVKTRLDIVPLSLRQFRDYFVAIFRYGHHESGEIVDLLKQCVVSRDSYEAPEWQRAIGRSVSSVLAMKRRASMVILDEVDAEEKFSSFLPFYANLKAACGAFGEGSAVDDPKWIKVEGIGRVDDTMYVVQASGHSMEPEICDGDLCVMRKVEGGNYENRIMLVQHSSIADPETGGAYTIKKFTRNGEDVVLVPVNSDYQKIIIRHETDDDQEHMLIGVYYRKIET